MEHVYGLHVVGAKPRVVAEYVVFDSTEYRGGVRVNSDHTSSYVILECVPCNLKILAHV